MRFITDQNFPRACQPLLAEFGHELCDLRFPIATSAPDDWIFTEAQRLDAVLLTTDKDFFHTVPFRYSRHAGVIVVNLDRPNRPRILDRLRHGLALLAERPIRNHVLLILDRHVLHSQRTGDG